MRLLAFAVYDRAARAYYPPLFHPTRGLAERQFADALSDQATLLSKHPADFELFEVGTFDTESGVLVARETVELLTTGVQTLSLKAVQNA